MTKDEFFICKGDLKYCFYKPSVVFLHSKFVYL